MVHKAISAVHFLSTKQTNKYICITFFVFLSFQLEHSGDTICFCCKNMLKYPNVCFSCFSFLPRAVPAQTFRMSTSRRHYTLQLSASTLRQFGLVFMLQFLFILGFFFFPHLGTKGTCCLQLAASSSPLHKRQQNNISAAFIHMVGYPAVE